MFLVLVTSTLKGWIDNHLKRKPFNVNVPCFSYEHPEGVDRQPSKEETL